MKRHLITLASLVTVFVLCAASPRDLPPEVAAHLAEMDDVCKVVGTPVERPHVEHGYLGSDRLEIWAIDEGQYYCDGAASLYSGTAGSAVVVFMRLPDNHIKKVYDIFVYGMRLEHTGTSDTLWVNVAGKICGQPGEPTHATQISCELPLQWDAAQQLLDFAPLSQARFK